MLITMALIIFTAIWVVLFLVALPIGLNSQQQSGEIVPGTPSSAPVNPVFRKKLIVVTIVTLLIWLPLMWVIYSGQFTMRDFDFYNRMGPAPQSEVAA